jgi:hypothetical protein
MWIATNHDPLVTFSCNSAYSVYGCTDHGRPVSSYSYTAHVPANSRPGCMDPEACGDVNFSVVQPNGDVFMVYGCVPLRDFRNGDVIDGVQSVNRPYTVNPAISGANASKKVCAWVNGQAVADIQTGMGVNRNVTSGADYPAEVIRYHELVTNGYISHAINLPVSCTSKGYVYPGTSLTKLCDGSAPDVNDGAGINGVPAGTRFFLDRSVAQIDAMIAAGTLNAKMRAVYVALHEYGGYIVDAGEGTVPSFDTGSGGPHLEDARVWITNGQHNPWVDWFATFGATYHRSQAGNPFWEFTVNLWPPLQPYLKALDPCYAAGTCSDSVTPGPTRRSGPVRSPQPAPPFQPPSPKPVG